MLRMRTLGGVRDVFEVKCNTAHSVDSSGGVHGAALGIAIALKTSHSKSDVPSAYDMPSVLFTWYNFTGMLFSGFRRFDT